MCTQMVLKRQKDFKHAALQATPTNDINTFSIRRASQKPAVTSMIVAVT